MRTGEIQSWKREKEGPIGQNNLHLLEKKFIILEKQKLRKGPFLRIGTVTGGKENTRPLLPVPLEPGVKKRDFHPDRKNTPLCIPGIVWTFKGRRNTPHPPRRKV